jgi:hypothetical protein
MCTLFLFNALSDAAQNSFNFQSGIMLLEKMILMASKKEKGRIKHENFLAKIDKGSKRHDAMEDIPQSNTTDIWIQLARLYRSIGDEDTFKGVFEKEIAKHEYRYE